MGEIRRLLASRQWGLALGKRERNSEQSEGGSASGPGKKAPKEESLAGSEEKSIGEGEGTVHERKEGSSGGSSSEGKEGDVSYAKGGKAPHSKRG